MEVLGPIEHMPDEIKCCIISCLAPRIKYKHKLMPSKKDQYLKQVASATFQSVKVMRMINKHWKSLVNDELVDAFVAKRIARAVPLSRHYSTDKIFFSLLIKREGSQALFIKKINKHKHDSHLIADLLTTIQKHCPILEKQRTLACLNRALGNDYNILLDKALKSRDSDMRILVKLPLWVDDDKGRARLSTFVPAAENSWAQATKTTEVLDFLAIFKVMAFSGVNLSDGVLSYMFNINTRR